MASTAQEHMRRAPAIQPWLNVARGSAEPYGRRLHLYVQAAPVFEEHGYRGATIKALAHACGLSPASLYHYFGSKAEMATYPLTAPALSWENTFVDPDLDPLIQLSELLDMSVAMFPIWNLAMRLYAEIEGQVDERVRSAGFRQGEAVFGRLLFAVASELERADAEAIARDVLASLVGTAHTGLDPDVSGAQRERMVQVLRSALVPEHLDAARFEVGLTGRGVAASAATE